ncbi:hypothetical protein [Rivularia sp. PCC 7116]|nr:hypothetical protein [Rivularia sp. PCC 7116]
MTVNSYYSFFDAFIKVWENPLMEDLGLFYLGSEVLSEVKNGKVFEI